MHEVALAEEIIGVVKKYLPKDLPAPVKCVRIELGEFSNIQPESLSFGFDVLTAGTELHGAELEIRRIPLTVKCIDCQSISTFDEVLFYCKSCDSINVEILTGTELNIIEIELI